MNDIGKKMMKFLRDFWPTLIVVAVILYATLASDPIGADELPQIPHIDKLIHAVMMGGLVGAIAFDIQRKMPVIDGHRVSVLTKWLMWLIFACVAGFGLIDEIVQALMDNGRGADPMDYVADLLGGVVAVFTAPAAIKAVLHVR